MSYGSDTVDSEGRSQAGHTRSHAGSGNRMFAVKGCARMSQCMRFVITWNLDYMC